MKILRTNPILFWYFRDGAELDLNEPWARLVYVKEVLSKGREWDIKELFGLIREDEFKKIFQEIKRHLPKKIKNLWEGYFERAMGTYRRSEETS